MVIGRFVPMDSAPKASSILVGLVKIFHGISASWKKYGVQVVWL
ncbi:MAG: hypothetical protein Q9P01_04805 [Anaerolineae bacterium]|nr:hypothetical protein [Anaerolineae bacterium]